jgi:hypothetical protein
MHKPVLSSLRRNPRFPGALLLGQLLLTACAHVNVQDVGNGRHSLVAVSHSGGYDGSHEEAVELANDYCGRRRQTAVIEGFDDKPGVGPEGEHTSSLLFTCAAPKALHF